MSRQHTAGLIVKVIPSGQPGEVFIEVENLGPETLTRSEMLAVLRQATALAELNGTLDE